MTQYLADAAREVTAVEIDDALIPILKDTLKEWDNVTVIHGDILKTDIRKIAEEKNSGHPVKVVANLPYYITTPIIMGLFESHVPVDSVTVMVQKEVAERMQTGPDQRITELCLWQCSIMRSRKLLQMFLQIVLCRDQRSEARNKTSEI